MDITGMKELTARLQTLGAKAARIENQALRAGGEVVADAMRQNVNRSHENQTHIQDDIKVGNVKQNGSAKFVEVGPGKDTNWRAKFLEFGTSKMSPRPFMEVSATETQGEVVAKMADIMKGGLGL
ncbi:HK97 gp10 family phage protein [Aneurinibacillus sp. BA2021]|nr:HK97 gp10 family phage protein [Aneurinibacillus sp. BA2021]